MRSEYWREHWNKSAKENEDIRLISGWGNRTFQEMLFAITDVAKKIELKSSDRLLDAGCGAGLFEIVFAHWLKEIYAVDYSEEMVKVAKKNTGKYDNVIIENLDLEKSVIIVSSKIFQNEIINELKHHVNNGLKVVKLYPMVGYVKTNTDKGGR